MKWRLSGFSQVVQIRAPVSAAELRFPPAGTSQQTSTSIIPLMGLIRAGLAGSRGGGRSAPHAAQGSSLFPGGAAAAAPPAGTGRPPYCPAPWSKRELGMASPGTPTRSLLPSTPSPPSRGHRGCGRSRGGGVAVPPSPAAPGPGRWRRREGGCRKTDF